MTHYEHLLRPTVQPLFDLALFLSLFIFLPSLTTSFFRFICEKINTSCRVALLTRAFALMAIADGGV